jgi:hypothetical protein
MSNKPALVVFYGPNHREHDRLDFPRRDDAVTEIEEG